MKRLLDGFRVIDWSVHQAGPVAGAYLADLGADVIHVETPGEGDALRGVVSSYGVSPLLPHGRHVHFEEHNRNKRGLALNLKTPDGRSIMYRLVEKSDVFLTNMRLKARKSLGMDYETISRHNPRIIYGSASGLGEKGPFADLPSLDPVAQAWAGCMTVGHSPEAEPCWGIPSIGDRGTSLELAYGILAALLGRERGGEGQEVQVSQLGTLVTLQGYHISLPLLVGQSMAIRERENQRNPLYNFYRCGDGKWIVLAGFFADQFWPQLCRALGLTHLVDDPKFIGLQERDENARELVAIIDRALATKTREEWMKIFQELDLLAAPVHDILDVVDDPQVLANEYITDWDHPVLGKIRFVGHGVKFSKTPLEFRRPAPEIGEHTEEVLTEVCGYSWEDIALFQERGVL